MPYPPGGEVVRHGVCANCGESCHIVYDCPCDREPCPCAAGVCVSCFRTIRRNVERAIP